jgi:hypothetical protein
MTIELIVTIGLDPMAQEKHGESAQMWCSESLR